MEISEEVKLEVRALREKINRWNHEYYVWAAPSVSDSEFDKAFNRLRQTEQEHPELQDDTSPTRRVGSDETSVFAKVEHVSPMLSLEKAKTAKEVAKFFPKGTVGMVEPKIDGSSLSIHYVNGRLVRAVTRGDGTKGDEVTMNARTIRTLPLVLPERISCEVRGEVYIRWSHFEKYNAELEAEGEEPASNPRNAAAGALKLKDSRLAAKVPLSCIAYRIITREPLAGVSTQRACLERLEELGFVTTSCPPPAVESDIAMAQYDIDLSNVTELEELIRNLDRVRKIQDFPTDGLVFKADSLELQAELGLGTNAPKWAVAFKYPPEQVNTRLKGVTFTVGKTGKITPVGEMVPVLVSGTTVARANLCNADEIERLGVNVGDVVVLEKSNEIIPKVISVAEKRSKGLIAFPTKCPSCKSTLVRPTDLVDYFCQNPHCPDQIKARLVYATGKAALDIKGCGEAVIEELIGLKVRDLGAFMHKTGFKQLKSKALRDKLNQGVDQALRAHFWRKLSALCIEGWGVTTCQEVAARWQHIGDVADAIPDGQLAQIIGAAKVKTFQVKMSTDAEIVYELEDIGFWNVAEGNGPGILSGQVFCLTGAMTDCTNRDLVEEAVRERGGICKSSVSRKVHYLVVGESPGASKLTAAKRHGTKTITPDELYDMMKWRPMVT
jgi:DNA ligase (NAD+)